MLMGGYLLRRTMDVKKHCAVHKGDDGETGFYSSRPTQNAVGAYKNAAGQCTGVRTRSLVLEDAHVFHVSTFGRVEPLRDAVRTKPDSGH